MFASIFSHRAPEHSARPVLAAAYVQPLSCTAPQPQSSLKAPSPAAQLGQQRMNPWDFTSIALLTSTSIYSLQPGPKRPTPTEMNGKEDWVLVESALGAHVYPQLGNHASNHCLQSSSWAAPFGQHSLLQQPGPACRRCGGAGARAATGRRAGNGAPLEDSGS